MKAILLNTEKYNQLNAELSKLKGYPDRSDTHRVFPVEPRKAKVNVQFDQNGNETGFDEVCVAEISSENLELFPDYFAKYDLIDVWDINYTRDEETI
jgi:hypothetical protein